MRELKEQTNVEAARAAWGDDLPDWVEVLAAECDATTQVAVGKRIGVSGSAVNQVLRRRYTAGLDNIEARVKGVFMAATVACPVLGQVSSRRCLDEQARPFSTASYLSVRVYRACRGGCPNYRGKA